MMAIIGMFFQDGLLVLHGVIGRITRALPCEHLRASWGTRDCGDEVFMPLSSSMAALEYCMHAWVTTFQDFWHVVTPFSGIFKDSVPRRENHLIGPAAAKRLLTWRQEGFSHRSHQWAHAPGASQSGRG